RAYIEQTSEAQIKCYHFALRAYQFCKMGCLAARGRSAIDYQCFWRWSEQTADQLRCLPLKLEETSAPGVAVEYRRTFKYDRLLQTATARDWHSVVPKKKENFFGRSPPEIQPQHVGRGFIIGRH